jgi:hypothetical protein
VPLEDVGAEVAALGAEVGVPVVAVGLMVGERVDGVVGDAVGMDPPAVGAAVVGLEVGARVGAAVGLDVTPTTFVPCVADASQ